MVWPMGLIPAHAGKTKTSTVSRSAVGAHPRSRGENLGHTAARAGLEGSSPLTRGKPRRTRRNAQAVGLIPAHAGKTIVVVFASLACAAHPRSRGENPISLGNNSPDTGSSPLTRGKLCVFRGVRLRARLIPAHAGKTRQPRGRRPRLRAHPRSRGENRSVVTVHLIMWGSSPLTRGKPMSCRTVMIETSAHPRSRGENFG